MDKIKLYKNNIKKNILGNVYKYLDENLFGSKIAEVYFTTIKKNKIKAWKLNKSSDQFIYVIKGSVLFVLCDKEFKKKNSKKYILGKNQLYQKIYIPKNVWYGFMGLHKENLIANSLRKKHKECKFINLEHINSKIPYSW